MSKTNRRSTPKPAAEVQTRTPRELSPAQQIICDEIADMLTHGGREDDISNMLYNVLSHKWNRATEGIYDDEKKRDQAVSEFVDRDIRDYDVELKAEWKRNRRAKPEAADPKTVTDRIRQGIMDELRDTFESFLRHGTPEEHRFLRDVLVIHEGVNRGPHPGVVELALGEAFMTELEGDASHYIKVPMRLAEQVAKYAECLIAVDRDREYAASVQ
ncbi:MAG TPA: hypothetical protein VN442_00300 [Bryobacteraceae bacterium]|nr:hypothetical protein [Bryobacteraceae bacterium]